MAYELIETIEVGSGGVAALEFTSIPNDGVHLLLLLSSRADNGEQAFYTTINNSGGYVYPQRYQGFNGSSVQSASRDDNGFFFNFHNHSGTTTNTFSNTSLLISNYASSSFKSISTESSTENNSTSSIYNLIHSALYESTSAVSSIKMTQQLSGNFVQYTTASLYKIY